MPASWSKPYIVILKSKEGAWKEAKTSEGRAAIVAEVSAAIKEQQTQENAEAENIQGIDKVCTLFEDKVEWGNLTGTVNSEL
jgi:hypothetical protein